MTYSLYCLLACDKLSLLSFNYGSLTTFVFLAAPFTHIGTGVVTSVPSDSPDDYAALRDLQNKAVSHLDSGLKRVNFESS